MTEQPAPAWARLPNETEYQYATFQAFLNAGWPEGLTGPHKPRVLKEICIPWGVAETTAYHLSCGGNWYARARAYDEWVFAQRQERDASAIKRMRTGHERRLAKIGAIIDLELDKVLSRAQDPVTPVATVGELKQLLDFLHKQERLLHGEPTDEGTAAEDDEDYADWSPEQLKAALEVHDKATAEIRAKRGTTH